MLCIQTILVPTDFSESAEQALQVAHSLARDHHAKLVLMSAPPPPPPSAEVYVPFENYAGLIEEPQRQLTAMANVVTDLPVETRVLVGPPGPSIVECAKNCQADMIVMGTHGRSGLSRLIMGSVAEYVHRHAPCPVLTIKPGTVEHLRHEETTSLAMSESASSSA